ncbi:MAG: LAGLIDADG family homing endonuclease, partial [Nanoarchaeota archaeon]
ITHFGQFIIKLTAKEIEKQGYKVIYSDSVDGKTKIIVKKGKEVFEEEIQNLFMKVDNKTLGKEYNLKEDIQALTIDEKGNSVFKPIKYVMRHKADKNMFRVNFTNNWHIDVTEDHSLIGYQSLEFNNKNEYKKDFLKRLIEIKPEEIGKKVRTIISLKKIPYEQEESRNYSKEIYEFMGYFIGDGSFHRNKAHKVANKDYYLGLSLGLDQQEVLKKIIEPLKKEGYIKNYWLSSTRKGDITINGLKLINLFSKDFRDCDGKKCIPSWLFREKEENIASFLRGLFSADGTVMIRNNAPIIKFTSIDDNFIREVRKLLYRVGISHSVFKENSVNKYKTKEKTFCGGTYSKNILIQNKDVFLKKIGFVLDRKNKKADIKTNSTKKRNIKDFEFDIQGVKSVEKITTPKYVYDLEIEGNHKFFANYVLVHNTDSCFVNSRAKTPEQAEKIGKEIQEKINLFFTEYVKKNYKVKSFLELQFEKNYIRFLMPKIRGGEAGAKKRYAGLRLKEGKEKIDFVGIETARSDWTDVAKKFQLELLNRIFHKQEVTEFIKQFVQDIKKGKYDKLLIYRKSLRKGLEGYSVLPPHLKAAQKIKDFKGGLVEYYLTTDGPEPIQALKHKIDYEHYIKKQIKPIADSVLLFYNKTFEELLEGTKQTKLF